MMKRKLDVKVDEDKSDNEENKKIRREIPPSKVLHVRSLPDDVTEIEIASIATPFGHISYMVLTRKTGQALLEMETKEIAETMFEYYQRHSPHLRNKRCFIQYSHHSTLQSTESSMHPEAENAVSTTNQICDSMAKEQAGPVLRLVVDDWNHDKITNLHLFKIFQHYGILERIVIYINKGIVQGFIQYSEPFSAKVAKALTNGLCVFPRCCVLRVNFSNRQSLDISREDDLVRDFVRHPVSPQELKNVHVNIGGGMPKETERFRDIRDIREFRELRDPIDTLAALQPLLTHAATHPDDAMPLLRSIAPAIRGFLDNQDLLPRELSRHDRNDNFGRTHFGEKTSPLLIVSNLNEAKIHPDALFKLFGCYGDVTRVKIMYNRKNTALIQFATEEHAQRALQFLNGVNLYGKPLHVNFSKHDRISHRAPIAGSEEEATGDLLHREYNDSKLHRFKRAQSRNHSNIYEPSKVLHVAGLIDDVSEEDIEALFTDNKFRVKKIRVFNSSGKKMALVELSSVEAAIEALIELHDYDLCGSNLRVSFSKQYLN